MTPFKAQDPDYEARIRGSFERQPVMKLIGAELTRVEPGLVEIELPYRADLTQQHGFLHAGISTTIADSAGGYAAFTLMPAGSTILAVELKVNLLEPARGERFRARGRAVKSGRTISVSEIEVYAFRNEREVLCLTGLQTTICRPNRRDGPGAG